MRLAGRYAELYVEKLPEPTGAHHLGTQAYIWAASSCMQGTFVDHPEAHVATPSTTTICHRHWESYEK